MVTEENTTLFISHSPPKQKLKFSLVVSLFGLILLVIGSVAGFYLTQFTNQDVRQQAFEDASDGTGRGGLYGDQPDTVVDHSAADAISNCGGSGQPACGVAGCDTGFVRGVGNICVVPMTTSNTNEAPTAEPRRTLEEVKANTDDCSISGCDGGQVCDRGTNRCRDPLTVRFGDCGQIGGPLCPNQTECRTGLVLINSVCEAAPPTEERYCEPGETSANGQEVCGYNPITGKHEFNPITPTPVVNVSCQPGERSTNGQEVCSYNLATRRYEFSRVIPGQVTTRPLTPPSPSPSPTPPTSVIVINRPTTTECTQGQTNAFNQICAYNFQTGKNEFVGAVSTTPECDPNGTDSNNVACAYNFNTGRFEFVNTQQETPDNLIYSLVDIVADPEEVADYLANDVLAGDYASYDIFAMAFHNCQNSHDSVDALGNCVTHAAPLALTVGAGSAAATYGVVTYTGTAATGATVPWSTTLIQTAQAYGRGTLASATGLTPADIVFAETAISLSSQVTIQMATPTIAAATTVAVGTTFGDDAARYASQFISKLPTAFETYESASSARSTAQDFDSLQQEFTGTSFIPAPVTNVLNFSHPTDALKQGAQAAVEMQN